VLEHGTLACAVVTDDPEGLTLPQVEGDIIEDPELLRSQGAFPIRANSALDQRRNEIPERIVPLAAPEAFEYVIQSQRIFAHGMSLNALCKARLQASEENDAAPEKEAGDGSAVGQPREVGRLTVHDA
jgi:hypothetical protein